MKIVVEQTRKRIALEKEIKEAKPLPI